MAGKTREPGDEAFFWFKWTMAGAMLFIAIVFAFILS